MIVACDIQRCPFNYNGICRERSIRIIQNGCCSRITKSNWASPVDEIYKDQSPILNLIKKEEPDEEQK